MKNVAFDNLTEQFRRLPGIGGKMAQRLAFYVLSMSEDEAQAFADAVVTAKTTVHRCPICGNLTDTETCSVCSDVRRDHSVICVVANPSDVLAIEKSHGFHGVYHVLHGLISPSDNIGPNELFLKELLVRLQGDEVKEVILATNPTVEGDATAMYLSRLLKPLGVQISRLAFGLPVGGDLEYADEMTLNKALENRREI